LLCIGDGVTTMACVVAAQFPDHLDELVRAQRFVPAQIFTASLEPILGIEFSLFFIRLLRKLF